MAEYYVFVNAEPVTEFVPPNSSKRVYQVRGVEPHSGIYFLSLMSRKSYLDAAYRNNHMGRLGRALYLESLTPHVRGISVRQTQDAQSMLRNELEVTVESSSGNSSGQVTLPYPNPAHIDDSVKSFQHAVAAEVRLLDAAEDDGSTDNTTELAADLEVVAAAEQRAATGLADFAN